MSVALVQTGVQFADGTIQTTAGRGIDGITTITFQTAQPSATLTTASKGTIVIVQQGTTAIAEPSLILPDMTGIPIGTGYFEFKNLLPIAVKLKDQAGTFRQLLAPSSTSKLTVVDNQNASGVWFTDLPMLVAADYGKDVQSITGFRQSGTYTIQGKMAPVKLSETQFAVVWLEASATPTPQLYAKLFTVNTQTKTITAGNVVQLGTVTTQLGTATSPDIYQDYDGQGHALVAIADGTGQLHFGLQVQGGTLYGTQVVQITLGSNPNNVYYVSYLGSNNAFAVCYGCIGATRITGATVTGTTAPVLTTTASVVSITTTGTDVYAQRTGTTSFLLNTNTPQATNSRYIQYAPATNTFTYGTRTTTQLIDIDNNTAGNYQSTADGGFIAASGGPLYGPYVYTVTNAGAAGVTASFNTTALKGTAPVTNNYPMAGAIDTSAYRQQYYNSTSLDHTQISLSNKVYVHTQSGTQVTQKVASCYQETVGYTRILMFGSNNYVKFKFSNLASTTLDPIMTTVVGEIASFYKTGV